MYFGSRPTISWRNTLLYNAWLVLTAKFKSKLVSVSSIQHKKIYLGRKEIINYY